MSTRALLRRIERVEKALSRSSAKVEETELRKIEIPVLEHELMVGAVGLDWHTNPNEKLNTIKTCFVVKGILETGNTRCIIPPEEPYGSGGIYQSLFSRLASSNRFPDVDASQTPIEQDNSVRDLYPQPPKPAPFTPLPAAGESIDEADAPPKASSRVITVEVG